MNSAKLEILWAIELSRTSGKASTLPWSAEVDALLRDVADWMHGANGRLVKCGCNAPDLWSIELEDFPGDDYPVDFVER